MTKKEFIALYAERANFETKVDAEKKLDTDLVKLFCNTP